ncbi:MAG: peptidoglycan-binding protein, partial [Planctomycetaceae bacterium]|nr:peptidoglycan-binding protein [Planctomycetaceae bacterium]
EMLQRTLNARLDPSPRLLVDGDFGSVTEVAVREFQRSRQLPETGIVDAAFWQALGPTVQAGNQPDMELVNAEQLPLAPPDDTDGPPFVTCRAWSIVDTAGGKTLWSHQADEELNIASTTKIMTAWLVLKLARSEPSVLEETVVFSSRADGTIGSTSDLWTGEKLSVREALYGLMLPSGNDMSVALAEHFGARLASVPSDDASNATEAEPLDPLDQFVEAMNSEAPRLGMQHTRYRNPHGLTAPGHLSTAADLATLAKAALADERFRAYVSTRQHAAMVEGSSGYQRQIVWKNTNQLLGIEGYGGIKTGTTDAAGACLVSTASRGDRQLILVVLGSAASPARYTDSRNLYRWAWQELEEE